MSTDQRASRNNAAPWVRRQWALIASIGKTPGVWERVIGPDPSADHDDVHVREVLPGERSFTREEMRELIMSRMACFGSLKTIWESMIEELLNEAFGALPEGKHTDV